ncbi:MAG TPA: hypothetical protein VHD83_17860 [Puia sp.]|nr:hypothetical protein [Puia sp.]
MNFLFSFFLMLILSTSLSVKAKQTYTITADSTKLTGYDSNELVIENYTKNVLGYLYNTGNERTIFKKPLTNVNDTTYVVRIS